MDQQKTFVVPAFLLVEAESAASADEVACNVADTINNLPHGHGYASLRLDECLATLEAPEGFPGESLLQLDEDEEPAAGGDVIDVLAALRRILAGLQELHGDTRFGLGYEIELAHNVITNLERGAA